MVVNVSLKIWAWFGETSLSNQGQLSHLFHLFTTWHNPGCVPFSTWSESNTPLDLGGRCPVNTNTAAQWRDSVVRRWPVIEPPCLFSAVWGGSDTDILSGWISGELLRGWTFTVLTQWIAGGVVSRDGWPGDGHWQFVFTLQEQSSRATHSLQNPHRV